MEHYYYKMPTYFFFKNLTLGNKGKDVKSLQTLLKLIGFHPSAITTYYGLNTLNAVLKFQRVNKLERTGILDSSTRKIANQLLKQPTKLQKIKIWINRNF